MYNLMYHMIQQYNTVVGMDFTLMYIVYLSLDWYNLLIFNGNSIFSFFFVIFHVYLERILNAENIVISFASKEVSTERSLFEY